MNKCKWVLFWTAVIGFLVTMVYFSIFLKRDVPGSGSYKEKNVNLILVVDEVSTYNNSSRIYYHITYDKTRIDLEEEFSYTPPPLVKGNSLLKAFTVYYYLQNNGYQVRFALKAKD